MERLVERVFEVESSPAETWSVLIDARTWPRWAAHLRRVDLQPEGTVTASTSAVLTLSNRTKARVTVTEFEDGRRFRWDGSFLWLRLAYDHVCEPSDSGGATVSFIVDAAGWGVNSIGRVFARIYDGNLDTAIPSLQALLRSRPK